MELLFNRAQLSQITRATPALVSKAISVLGVEPAKQENSVNKRYDIENSRKITNHIFASTKRPIVQKTQVFYNFKGGTGKTSLCYQVSSHLALLGFNVLALDLDPQGHLSSALGLQEGWNGPTIYDVMIHGVPFEDALLTVCPGFDLLPANISMTRIEVPLSAKTKREEVLKLLLAPFRDSYDFIIMDTNPTISTLNMNAQVASDRINIVCETQPFSLNGVRVLIEELLAFHADMGIEPNYCIIPNKYEIKTASAQEVLGSLRNEYGDKVLSAMVRKSEDINIANKKGLPISAFCKAKSSAFEDIMDLVHVIIDQSISPTQPIVKVA